MKAISRIKPLRVELAAFAASVPRYKIDTVGTVPLVSGVDSIELLACWKLLTENLKAVFTRPKLAVVTFKSACAAPPTITSALASVPALRPTIILSVDSPATPTSIARLVAPEIIDEVS